MKVSIENLTFKTIIGVLPFERENKQLIKIDIFFEYHYSENTKLYVDYSEVAKLVEKTMKKKKFELIEEAIVGLEKKLHQKFQLLNLTIKITKPTILKNCIVGVSN